MTNTLSEFEKTVVPAKVPSPTALVDQLFDYLARHDASSLLVRFGVGTRLKKQLAECILNAELKHHLVTEAAQGTTKWRNFRNGSTPKTVFTPSGELELDIPRVRYATFEPSLIPRYRRHLSSFDDSVLTAYARGMNTDQMQTHVLALYDTAISPELVSTVADEVLAHTRKWQARLLEKTYAVVYFDSLLLRVQPGDMENRTPVHFALGMNMDGHKDVLGFWVERTPASDFWRAVILELRNRGLADMQIAVHRGQQGLNDAVSANYPGAQLIHCTTGQFPSD